MRLTALTNQQLIEARAEEARRLRAAASALDSAKAPASRAEIDAAMDRFHPLDAEARRREIV